MCVCVCVSLWERQRESAEGRKKRERERSPKHKKEVPGLGHWPARADLSWDGSGPTPQIALRCTAGAGGSGDGVGKRRGSCWPETMLRLGLALPAATNRVQRQMSPEPKTMCIVKCASRCTLCVCVRFCRRVLQSRVFGTIRRAKKDRSRGEGLSSDSSVRLAQKEKGHGERRRTVAQR